MHDVRRILAEDEHELEKIILNVQHSVRKGKSGWLRIDHNKGTVQYYLMSNSDKRRGKYIRKSSMELIKQLAQKDYAQKMLEVANQKLQALTIFTKDYFQKDMTEVYQSLPPERRELVEPYELSEEMYAQRWQAESYPPYVRSADACDETSDDNGIYTEKNEKVRSKSEKIIADKFYMKQVPYHYEKPLVLPGFGTVHPDFTVLNKKSRKEYYWEHLGMMGNPEYCENAIRKIQAYEKSGIFLGENLILTYESAETILDSRHIDRLIRKYLL